VILSPGKHHLSEKQQVISVGRGVEKMPGIVRGMKAEAKRESRKTKAPRRKPITAALIETGSRDEDL
jgi:hypothetical protein